MFEKVTPEMSHWLCLFGFSVKSEFRLSGHIVYIYDSFMLTAVEFYYGDENFLDDLLCENLFSLRFGRLCSSRRCLNAGVIEIEFAFDLSLCLIVWEMNK